MAAECDSFPIRSDFFPISKEIPGGGDIFLTGRVSDSPCVPHFQQSNAGFWRVTSNDSFGVGQISKAPRLHWVSSYLLRRSCVSQPRFVREASYPGKETQTDHVPRRGSVTENSRWTQPLQGRCCSWLGSQGSRDARQPWAMRLNSFGVRTNAENSNLELLNLSLSESHLNTGCDFLAIVLAHGRGVASQTFTVPSPLADASRFPSTVNATVRTALVCPFNVSVS